MALKILFADDSMTAQNMGKKILSDAGYEVIAVSNGAAALKKINELKPQLVVLDVYMPGYTGLEVCEKMRSVHETSKTPVLLTVGKMEAYKAEDGARVKADGVIIKPFEASDLLAAVEKLAGMAKAHPAAMSAVAGAKPGDYQTTVVMPPPRFEDDASVQPGTAEGQEEEHQQIRSKPAPVSVPSEMASHAAYGYDDLLAPPPTTPAAGANNTPVISLSTASQPEVAPEIPVSPKIEQAPSEAEFAISPVEISSSQEFSTSASAPEIEIEDPSALEVASASAPSAVGNDAVLERFDAILKGEPTPQKAAGYEATAVDPVPDIQVAIEAGFEPTLQSEESGPVSVSREPGLDPFSSEATAAAQSEYQSWDAGESASNVSKLPVGNSGPAASELTSSAAEGLVETLPIDQYVEPELQPEETSSEVIEVAGAETEIDDFEARVAAAMSAYKTTEEVQEEHEVASAITEREAEDAELAYSKYAVAHETEHQIEVQEIEATAVEEVEASEPQVIFEDDEPGFAQPGYEAVSDAVSEVYVSDEIAPVVPIAKAAAAGVALSGSDSELARALAEAVAAQNQTKAISAEPLTVEAAPRSVEATMISKIVSRVLERSLPDILTKVMAEIEKERESK